MGDINYMKVVITAMLFYSFAVNVYVYALPDDTRNTQMPFKDTTDDYNISSIQSDVQDNLERQTSIPVIEVGALVFYSGNILLDLVFNFAFAIPQMLIMLISGISLLFGSIIDSQLILILQSFITAAVLALYFIGAMQLLTGIRSGRVI